MSVSGYRGESRSVISREVTKGAVGFNQPRILPDGKSLLVTVINGFGGVESSVALLSLKTLKLRTILQSPTNPASVTPGYLVFGRGGSLWTVPFDLKSLQLAGPSAPVINGIANNNGGTFNQFAVSENGMLVYAPGSETRPEREIVEVDRNGATKVVTPSPVAYEDLSLSPDGKHFFFIKRLREASAPTELRVVLNWVHELGGGPYARQPNTIIAAGGRGSLAIKC